MLGEMDPFHNFCARLGSVKTEVPDSGWVYNGSRLFKSGLHEKELELMLRYSIYSEFAAPRDRFGLNNA